MAKIGDEVHLETANETGLKMQVVNPAHSVHFELILKEDFFVGCEQSQRSSFNRNGVLEIFGFRVNFEETSLILFIDSPYLTFARFSVGNLQKVIWLVIIGVSYHSNTL